MKTLSTPRRIRILFNGIYIADTCEAKYVWEHPYYPQYYLPRTAFDFKHPDLHWDKVEEIRDDADKSVAVRFELRSGERKLEKIIDFNDALDEPSAAELKGYVKVDFYEPGKLKIAPRVCEYSPSTPHSDSLEDKWFEEDTPIFVHPKDPFKRVDLIQSNRPVRVHIDGKQMAEATSSIHLYETGLPVRFYMPSTALDQRVLQRSDTKTQCPYKGESEYYNVVVGGKEHKDVVWYYSTPTIECAGIAGLCCFYNEKVDIEIKEGGVWKKLQRPKSPFT